MIKDFKIWIRRGEKSSPALLSKGGRKIWVSN
jgi:hypothetical protein